ncbi:MAG: sensor histidine kinase N-terminal domain-containing protein [Hydrogenophaga sp.]|uniref:ATP-binding protein n=1 Tax=Hydrogenophaga sp. TaxID=1904254 RepID=UPI0025BF6631|nr:ATP-binding protein [Hydrogenophaga sp.]MBT9550542.1 sensor histidine kinase N-terminal domain-containing protein [Hydrogenophaga sp.]
MTRFLSSLRARLLVFVLLAILATAVLQAALAYRAARAEADQIFDYHMQQTALSLRAGLPQALATGVIPLPAEEQDFDFVLQIWTLDGVRVFESAARAELPQRAVLGFDDVGAHGTRYRVYSLQARSFVIQVAQDMSVRQRMAGSLALRTALPILLLAPLLMGLVGWVVSRSLAPVARVQRQVAERQADDLTEVAETGLPDEVRPLVQELNGLLRRVALAFDAQQRFVADAAHELRSPLAALKLQVQGLQRAPDDATRERALERLGSGIDRATRLIEQLLVLARQQARAASGVRPEPVALDELVRSAVTDMAPAAQTRRIDMGLTQADAGQVNGHAEALRILVRNLLENAVKYTPEGGRVDVALRAGAGTLVLGVEDSGPGIPEAERERVLDRFYRLPEAASTGSGLGLAIVKAVADLHGAKLQLDASPTLGGLRVRVAFPLNRP